MISVKLLTDKTAAWTQLLLGAIPWALWQQGEEVVASPARPHAAPGWEGGEYLWTAANC